MTFILNILHSDFSVLLADKRAQTKGSITIKTGNTTINVAPGATVNLEGFFPKITLNKSSSLAVGVSGTIVGVAGPLGNHGYLEQVKSQVGIDESLAQIIKAITSAAIPDRSIFKTNTTFSQDQGIATFFDSAISMYFTLRYTFCEAAISTLWYVPVTSRSKVICCGSGADHFVAAVGQDTIEDFASSFTSADQLAARLDWFKNAFEKVSAVDTQVGKEFVGFISTRTNPDFRPLDLTSLTGT
jgi:hypothetical protein